MNCKDASQFLVAYLDGEVTPGERGVIDAHLSTCSWCREELEALTITQKKFRQALEYVDASPPPGAWLSMRRRIEAGKKPWFSIPRLKGLLTSRALAWKAAVGGALAVALIAGLVILTLTLMSAPAPVRFGRILEPLAPAKALAETIVLNSPEIQAAFGEEAGEITALHVTIRNGRGMVIMTAEGVSRFLAANIDLKERGVIDFQEITVEARLSWPELTGEEKEWAINIAKADPQVQELVARGAVIEYVTPSLSVGMETVVDWHGREVHETLGVTIDNASVVMQLGDTRWSILVNVEKQKVEYVIESPVIVLEEPFPRLGKEQALKAIDIARGHPLVQEFLDKGALIHWAHYPRTITCENGRTIISVRYGQEKAVVLILYPEEYGPRYWEVVVNLAEERVVSIEETEMGFDLETRTFIREERRIYP